MDCRSNALRRPLGIDLVSLPERWKVVNSGPQIQTPDPDTPRSRGPSLPSYEQEGNPEVFLVANPGVDQMESRSDP